MGIGSVFEAFNVVFDGLGVNSLGDGSFSKDDGVMDSLSTTENFLSSHKEVKGAGKIGIVFADSRVKRPGFDRIPVEHVEISIILLSH